MSSTKKRPRAEQEWHCEGCGDEIDEEDCGRCEDCSIVRVRCTDCNSVCKDEYACTYCYRSQCVDCYYTTGQCVDCRTQCHGYGCTFSNDDEDFDRVCPVRRCGDYLCNDCERCAKHTCEECHACLAFRGETCTECTAKAFTAVAQSLLPPVLIPLVLFYASATPDVREASKI